MAKTDKALTGGDTGTVADDAVHSRGGLNQKARTMAEAKKAWGRRIRRKSKAYRGDDLRAYLDRLAGTDPSSIPSDAEGLAWVRKGSAAECGDTFSVELFTLQAGKVYGVGGGGKTPLPRYYAESSQGYPPEGRHPTHPPGRCHWLGYRGNRRASGLRIPEPRGQRGPYGTPPG